ncbi:isoleucine--tRNA ligase [Novosphingobium marinum]|uniref:Isoleucine--tRNA ligase n=1 Tax=Novosphingobium marinum TaxID=1514948 RepID=A0A7Y9XWF3_9SPHN|nr:isoleucine--tRNA ligase [Novosphingobium marinum]NYH95725.1 isoleucyl-tRNA synthetase [Novosphingobium marinum]GGC29344.1 isoleucine--tRNA ligase [Novosphingobium marinum]
MTDERDYRDTVFLPKTDFPMKAGLPQKEPGILARWQEQDLYRRIRDARAGREKFILHDGPPYANGDIHVGHALNHVLKDMVVRTQTLLGKDAPYVPGWDCHGLPIEWKVEEQYRKKKKNKDEVPPREFRAECRAYAAHWVDVQREQLKRLGIGGDWDNPYLTMDFAAESLIVAELLKFAESGMLYRGAKPVMWSPVEKTALAEAEVEYEDIVSTQIDVAFEIVESAVDELVGAHAVIWTTTPWTIPVNQAIAYGSDVDYVLVAFDAEPEGYGAKAHPSAEPGARSQVGRKVLVAEVLLEKLVARMRSLVHDKVEASEAGEETLLVPHILKRLKGSELAGTKARHPMADALPESEFFARPRPLLDGSDFVTTDSGTGLVHMAPDHGEDDFDLCKAHGLEPVFAVGPDGLYRDDWPWLGGSDERRRAVINPNLNAPPGDDGTGGPICEDLKSAGALLSASADYQHSYPHSWRSKKKIIFRCTPQWFVPMDKPMQAHGDRTLRETALGALAETRFVPAKGRNRIGSMVEGRPDWVLSRQRAWGVPITLFVDRKSGQYLADPQVNARIVTAIRNGGVDAWSDENAQALLGDGYNIEDFERITDILDVWFDSGSTHAFVLESGKWPELRSPADLYLEGSDQHRGWFQSSLLESCGTRGRAPYKAVLTHGFTMDARGEKMSKSKGNTVSPLQVMEQYGADIIRLWALSVDYTEDHRIGDQILKGVADQYRKLRNTFRYLLGALADFDESERVEIAEMPELERYVLALLGDLDGKLRGCVDEFDFNDYTRALVDFCNEDLSAFFFDIRKDCLYCDAPDDPGRRAYRTVLDALFHALVRYAAPVLVFTAEEVWQTRFPDAGSIHLLEWPEVPEVEADRARWKALRDLREDVNEAIEPLRREKVVRSSLEAEVTVPGAAPEADLEELFITASVARGQGDDVSVSRTSHHKCGRCWRHLPEVGSDGELCGRCESVVASLEGAQ